MAATCRLVIKIKRKNNACSLIEDIQSGSIFMLSCNMKILCESGIITSRQDGKWTHYRINPEGCAYALKRLQKILAGDD